MTAMPPRRAERFMKWSLPPWERPAVLGDLNEEFDDLSRRRGRPAAHRWYWRQAVLSTWPNLLRRFRGDERRQATAQMGLLYLALGLVSLLLDLNRPRSTSWPVYALIGALALYDSLFRKRLFWRPSRRRQTTKSELAAALGALIGLAALGQVVARRFRITDSQITIFFVVFLLIAFLWPRRPRVLKEFAVRHKLTADLEQEALLAVTVPRKPLGLSDPVLCNGSAAESSSNQPRPLHIYDPAGIHEFRTRQSVRVYGVVNLPEQRDLRASVELVDSLDRIVKSVPAPVVEGALEETSDSWDDFADTDPADHFGQIDVTLPLSDVAPGRYRVRIAAGDNRGRAEREESILVRE